MNTTITIGRNPRSTIIVGEQYDTVSNDHAEIVEQGNEIMFTDHSSNGTIINGQKIHSRSVNIYPGDKIILGSSYELRWEQIASLIKPTGRPTVARNIRGDIQTMPPSSASSSRPTELYERTFADGRAHGPTIYETSATTYQSSNIQHRSEPAKQSSSQVDHELSKWNWGAFYFGWIWGVFNNVYISLVQLVVGIFTFALNVIGLNVIAPIFGIINIGISVWLGVKGSKMAWENGAYRNLEHFRTSRYNWNKAAAIVFAISILFTIIALILFIDIISQMF